MATFAITSILTHIQCYYLRTCRHENVAGSTERHLTITSHYLLKTTGMHRSTYLTPRSPTTLNSRPRSLDLSPFTNTISLAIHEDDKTYTETGAPGPAPEDIGIPASEPQQQEKKKKQRKGGSV
jgi:hypothetical protein